MGEKKQTNITKSLTTKIFFSPQPQHIINCINSHGKALLRSAIKKINKKRKGNSCQCTSTID